jgi:hypothetical protein
MRRALAETGAIKRFGPISFIRLWDPETMDKCCGIPVLVCLATSTNTEGRLIVVGPKPS